MVLRVSEQQQWHKVSSGEHYYKRVRWFDIVYILRANRGDMRPHMVLYISLLSLDHVLLCHYQVSIKSELYTISWRSHSELKYTLPRPASCFTWICPVGGYTTDSVTKEWTKPRDPLVIMKNTYGSWTFRNVQPLNEINFDYYFQHAFCWLRLVFSS